jgi:hypothetical protein
VVVLECRQGQPVLASARQFEGALPTGMSAKSLLLFLGMIDASTAAR